MVRIPNTLMEEVMRESHHSARFIDQHMSLQIALRLDDALECIFVLRLRQLSLAVPDELFPETSPRCEVLGLEGGKRDGHFGRRWVVSRWVWAQRAFILRD